MILMTFVLAGGIFALQQGVQAAESLPAPLVFQTTNLHAVLGRTLTLPLQVNGGTAPYSWMLEGSRLPDGIFFDRDGGRLIGSPGSTGSFPFTVRVEDVTGSSTVQALTLNVGMAGSEYDVTTQSLETTITVNLDTLEGLDQLLAAYDDSSPLIYVGPNAPTSIQKINIAQMRIKPNSLYRVEEDTSSNVYYIGADARRHIFATEDVLRSWYPVEPTIQQVPAWKISNILMGKNVTFRPGTIVHLEGTQQYYVVLSDRVLRKFQDIDTYLAFLKAHPENKANVYAPILPVTSMGDYVVDTQMVTMTESYTTLRSANVPGDEM